MTDLDRDLARRLERLSEAVPVRPGQLDPVHVKAVAARHQVRMRWVTPVLALVVLGLFAAVVGVGPFNVLSQSIATTTRNGDFELTLSAPKGTWASGEQIEMSATLTYVGPQSSVQISHDKSPFIFGMTEPVHGLLLNGIFLDVCSGSQLERDVGITAPFRKMWGSLGPIPPEAEAFARQPGLKLPPGTWHPWVMATFSLGDCGDPVISMEAVLEIVVSDGPVDSHPTPGSSDIPTVVPNPTSLPSAEAGTPPPSLPAPTYPAGAPVSSSADDGPATLQLTADQAVYAEGTAIDLEVAYSFADGHQLVASYYQPELYLMLTQLDATDPTSRGTSYDTVCTDIGRVDGTTRRVALTGFNVARITADTVPKRLDDLFVDGKLRLPVGRWEINVDVEGAFAPCDRGAANYESYALETSIVIEVVPR